MNKVKKKISYLIIAIISIVFIFLVIFFQVENLQNYLVDKFIKSLNKDIENREIKFKSTKISYDGRVKFEDILVLDSQKDTLVYFKEILSKIDIFNLIIGNYKLKYLKSKKFVVKINQYKTQNKDIDELNFLDKILEKINKNDYKDLNLWCDNILLENGKFIYTDHAKLDNRIELDDVHININNINLKNIKSIQFDLDSLKFSNNKGLGIENVSFKIRNKDKIMFIIKDFVISTKNESKINLVAFIKRDLKNSSIYKYFWDIDIFNTNIKGNDLSYLSNYFEKSEDIDFRLKLKGDLNNLKIESDINENKLEGTLSAYNIFKKKGSEINFKIDSSYWDFSKLVSIIDSNKLKENNIYDKIYKLDKANIKAKLKLDNYKDLYSNIDILGDEIASNINMKIFGINSNIEDIKYEVDGNIYLADTYNLFGYKDISDIKVALIMSGKSLSKENFSISSNINIEKMYLNNYRYKNFNLIGNITNKQFSFSGAYEDDNLSFDVKFDIVDDFMNLDLDLDKCDLYKLNLSNDNVSMISSNIDFRLSMPVMDKFSGDIILKNIIYENSNSIYFFEDMSITLKRLENNIKNIEFKSNNAINGHINYNFEYDKILVILDNFKDNFYSLKNKKLISDDKEDIYLDFDIRLNNSLISTVFPDINFLPTAFIKGGIKNNRLKLNFSSPNFEVYGNRFDNIRVSLDDIRSIYINVDNIKAGNYEMTDFNLKSINSNKINEIEIYFYNKGKKQNLNLYRFFDNDKKNIIIGFNPSTLVIDNKKWYINKRGELKDNFFINTENNYTIIKSFDIESEKGENISLKGFIAQEDNYSLNLNTNNFLVGDILGNLEDIKLKGISNSKISLLYSDNLYKINSNIKINNFSINNVDFGVFNLISKWNEPTKKTLIKANIKNKDRDLLVSTGDLFLSDDSNICNFSVKLNKIKAKFLEYFLENVFTDMDGFISSKDSIIIQGDITNPNFNGNVYLQRLSMRIPYTNANYTFSGSPNILLNNKEIILKEIDIIDNIYNTKGNMNAKLTHNSFSDLSLDFDINSQDLLLLDTKEIDGMAYYGRIFANGNIKIKGPTQDIHIDMNLKPLKKSSLYTNLKGTKDLEVNKFIKFKKDKNRLYLNKKEDEQYLSSISMSKVSFNLNTNITNDLMIKIIINDNYDEYIEGIGEGNINMNMNNLGSFNIYGNYTIEDGEYMFTLGNIFSRKFNIIKGGTIKWNGNIYNGILDVSAFHRIKADISNFISNEQKRKTNIDLMVNLSNRIIKPDFDLDVVIPNSNLSASSDLKERLNDKDQKINNFISLMLFNTFVSGEDNFVNFTIKNISTKELLIDRMLDFIPDLGLMNIDLKYSENNSIDGLQSNDELEFIVSGNIINDDIKIQSTVGMPIGSAKSGLAGDIDIEINLNEKKNFKLNIFNKSNEATNFYDPSGFTQGIGISYLINFDSMGDLYRSILGVKEEEEEEVEIPDKDN